MTKETYEREGIPYGQRLWAGPIRGGGVSVPKPRVTPPCSSGGPAIVMDKLAPTRATAHD